MEPIRNVLCALDLADGSRRVLESAAAVARQLGATLRAVHVVHDLERYMGFYVGTASLPKLQEELEREAQQKVRALVREVFGDEEAVPVAVVKGTPYADLVAHAREVEADLIVVGAVGHSKPEHKMFGSVAERLCRHAPCPVLVVGQQP